MNEQWKQAQLHERQAHTEPESVGWDHYRQSYRQYFNYTGVAMDLQGKSVIEIGPADYPALAYCTNYGPSIIMEPMPSTILESFVSRNKLIALLKEPAETYEFPPVDEVWLFNLLQHVINPDIIVRKAKEAAKVVRFFEPINMPTDTMHLHTFSLNTFYAWFGNCVRHYPDNPHAVNFHTHECAYGAWIKENNA